MGGLRGKALALSVCGLGVVEVAVAETSVTSDKPFELGVIEITAEGKSFDVSDPGALVIDGEALRRPERQTVSDILRDQPGLSLRSASRRNEDKILIRGFDSRQTTLNIDGMPVYVPYDGNVDLSRFLGAALAQISVSKGMSSLMYGPNNMGGSINLVTQRPEEELSGRVHAGGQAGRDGVFGRHLGAQIGSRPNEWFYVQAGVERRSESGYPLSRGFEAVPSQPSGKRLNSYETTTNTNLRLGFTPGDDDYSLSYYGTRGDKGSPPYTGSVPGEQVRYWQWPYWRKNGLYYTGETHIGPGVLSTRLYYDTFENSLSSYDDADYNSMSRGYAFRNEYDDNATGGGLQWEQAVGDHQLRAMAQFKLDVHKSRDLSMAGVPISGWEEDKSEIYSAGIEDRWQLTDNTDLAMGYRVDRFEVTGSDQTAPDGSPVKLGDPEYAHNFQLVLSHDVAEQTVFAGVSRKTRFPSIKEMFSYRLGQAIPNPSLGPETANHVELGSRGQLAGSDYQLSLFYSRVEDAIESVSIGGGLNQAQNIGDATRSGIELSMSRDLGRYFAVSGHYSYLHSEAGDDELNVRFLPRHSGQLALDWSPMASLTTGVSMNGRSRTESSTDGSQPVGGYATVDLHARYTLSRQVTLRAGVRNLGDRNYALHEGYPEPGRTFHGDVEWQF
ncbi:MAG TPA: TonB-dependent receptor [Guyparkeria sp.]|nr:TonB-dependent receptor [Guyparkeria sp.]